MEGKVSTKDKTFGIWVYSCQEKSKMRGMQGKICCDICGAAEESINHVFFECPPARQIWAL